MRGLLTCAIIFAIISIVYDAVLASVFVGLAVAPEVRKYAAIAGMKNDNSPQRWPNTPSPINAQGSLAFVERCCPHAYFREASGSYYCGYWDPYYGYSGSYYYYDAEMQQCESQRNTAVYIGVGSVAGVVGSVLILILSCFGLKNLRYIGALLNSPVLLQVGCCDCGGSTGYPVRAAPVYVGAQEAYVGPTPVYAPAAPPPPAMMYTVASSSDGVPPPQMYAAPQGAYAPQYAQYASPVGVYQQAQPYPYSYYAPQAGQPQQQPQAYYPQQRPAAQPPQDADGDPAGSYYASEFSKDGKRPGGS